MCFYHTGTGCYVSPYNWSCTIYYTHVLLIRVSYRGLLLYNHRKGLRVAIAQPVLACLLLLLRFPLSICTYIYIVCNTLHVTNDSNVYGCVLGSSQDMLCIGVHFELGTVCICLCYNWMQITLLSACSVVDYILYIYNVYDVSVRTPSFVN